MTLGQRFEFAHLVDMKLFVNVIKKTSSVFPFLSIQCHELVQQKHHLHNHLHANLGRSSVVGDG